MEAQANTEYKPAKDENALNSSSELGEVERDWLFGVLCDGISMTDMHHEGESMRHFWEDFTLFAEQTDNGITLAWVPDPIGLWTRRANQKIAAWRERLKGPLAMQVCSVLSSETGGGGGGTGTQPSALHVYSSLLHLASKIDALDVKSVGILILAKRALHDHIDAMKFQIIPKVQADPQLVEHLTNQTAQDSTDPAAQNDTGTGGT